ncbi:DUF2147 domain-containing protein [Caldithrix abyssi]|uniref:Uncharacterized conserved protein, DUF2147 family n=1 Tax=Caldithrix abyssi DSM 13497 TaxID=880073 RepID=H1XRQ7_CALAY|nr:DUF2147 domain-containing protein [Caldithrix abyssi]APF17126.1 Uncharacterized conserved protein, DUF2147 family [Caldithrix abyssi DSM 13497]EHO41267.1 Protein of unknown function DUF2147 [Caldithrix abyssi DSM 13497]
MKPFSFFLIFFILSLFTTQAFAQQDPIIGKWKTIDDETGQPKSIVEIYMRDGKFYGRVDSLFRKPGEDPNPKCDKCPEDDPRYNQPVLGMEIIKDMVKDGDEYTGGTILDPKKGKIYRCKLWLEDGKLMVRGYVAFFYRTQTWYRVK